MKRHRFDPLSFVFGACFLGLALVLSFESLEVGPGMLRWIGAAFLLVIGTGMLIGTFGRSRDESAQEDR